MGEGAARVTTVEIAGADGRDRSEQIEGEIEAIRTDLDGLVGELDRRRHEAFDWRLQARRHRRSLWIAAGVVGVSVFGYAGLRARRRRLARAERLPRWRAPARSRRSAGSEIVVGVAKAAVPIVARTLLSRGLDARRGRDRYE